MSKRNETLAFSVGDRVLHTGHCSGQILGTVHHWTDVGNDRDAGYVWLTYDIYPNERPHQTSARWLVKQEK
jgi:hypothetical protein